MANKKKLPLQRDKNRVRLIIVNQLSVISYVRQQQPQQLKTEWKSHTQKPTLS